MDPTRRFTDLVHRADDEIPLDEVALCIAAVARAHVDVDAGLALLDGLAAKVAEPTLDGLRRLLFVDQRFRGDDATYDDPRNSFLDVVLERRRGIPISLSVLTMEVGRRVGVPLAGVGMPSHFLLRDKVDSSVFVDPFHGGRLLDAPGCRRLLESRVGDGVTWRDDYLAPVPRLAIVWRMLTNLKAHYQRMDRPGDLAWVMRLRVALPGGQAAEGAEFPVLVAPLN